MFRTLEQSWITPKGGALPLLVLTLVIAFELVNFAGVVANKRVAYGTRLRAAFTSTFVPMVPWIIVGGGLAAGAAHAYYTLGIGAVVVFGLLLVSSRLLISTAANAEQRARQIELVSADRDRLRLQASDVEERERRRIGEALHDEAMQSLLAARQDVIDAIGGDLSALESADAGLAESVTTLRNILGGLHLPEVPEAELMDALDDLVAGVRQRSGLEVTLEPSVDGVGADASLAFVIVKELVANVVRHADAKSLDVRVRETESGLAIEVTDDGIGMAQQAMEQASRDGHLGLELMRQRVKARDGEIVVRSDESGTTVHVRLPILMGTGPAVV